MQGEQIIGLQLSDVTRAERELLVGSFLSGLVSEKSTNYVVVNKTDAVVPFSNARQHKDNILLRYGKIFKYGGLIVFDSDDFAELCTDLRKVITHESYGKKNWLFFYDELIKENHITNFDSIVLVLKPSQSAVPSAYQYVRAMVKAQSIVPLNIIVYGERYIEKAAEFFLTLKNDLIKVSGESVPVNFAGFIFIPPGEKDLLIMFNTDIPRAFPKTSMHGQIAYCVRKITVTDEALRTKSHVERLLALR